MNKIPINTPIKDNSIKYLQIIREKEESIVILQTENEQLKKQIIEIQTQQFSEFNEHLQKIKKTEETNIRLKQMLQETQNYVLQYQQDLEQYQQLSEIILENTQFYKFNSKTTLIQRLQFLSSQVFNQQIIQLMIDLKQLIQQINFTINNDNILTINNIFTKYYNNIFNQYHPYSTKHLIEELLLIINKQCNLINTETISYSQQFEIAIQKINLFETSIQIISNEEDILKKKIKEIESNDDQLKQQYDQQVIQNQKLQEQINNFMKISERKPFIEILSAQDISSVKSSSRDDHELQLLHEQINQKETIISKLQITLNNLEKKQILLEFENQPWDLIINCQQNNLESLIQYDWTLHFKHEYGLSKYQQLITCYGSNSQLLQFILENIFTDQFNFHKLVDQEYIQIGNPQCVYLKSINLYEKNILIQTKVLSSFQNFSTFTNQILDAEIALNEFWLQFSLQNGILFLCLKNFNQENQMILENCLLIQNKLTFSILYLIIDEETSIQNLSQLIITKYQFILLDETTIIDYTKNNRILMAINDNFDVESILKQPIEQLNQKIYTNLLNSFIQDNIETYFLKSEGAKLEFRQSLASENVYEMQIIQNSQDQIKLKLARDTALIKEFQLPYFRYIGKSYEIIFQELLYEVRLKKIQVPSQGTIIKIKCIFNDDNLTTKQYILKSQIQKENLEEISYKTVDNKLYIEF